jgi:hypothetical protein
VGILDMQVYAPGALGWDCDCDCTCNAVDRAQEAVGPQENHEARSHLALSAIRCAKMFRHLQL